MIYNNRTRRKHNISATGNYSAVTILIFAFILISFISPEFSSAQDQEYNAQLGDFSIKKTNINKVTVYYFFPEKPKGIIYFFHGAGGRAYEWMQYSEYSRLIRDSILNGFGIIALETSDRDGKRWDFEDKKNKDIKLLEDIKKNILRKNDIDDTIPEFSVGLSNGGSFAPLAAYTFKFNAVCIICSPGYKKLFELEDYNIPVIFNFGENEKYVTTDLVEERAGILRSKDIPVEVNIKKRSTVTPELFTRVAGIEQEGSEVIFSMLKDNYFLDKENNFDYETNLFEFAWHLPEEYKKYEVEIRFQLGLTTAGHFLMSDFNRDMLNFFNRFLEKSKSQN